MKNETETKVKRINKPGGGRIADKNSKRQQGYKILNKMKMKARSVCLDKLMDELEINKPYASTLYADHRKMMKDNGMYTTVYRILEKRTGTVIKPYVSKADVFKAKKGDCTSLAQAKKAYIASQQASIKSARTLSV